MTNRGITIGAAATALLLALASPAATQSGSSAVDPKKQRKGLENFLKADKNKDGLLSRREFKKLIQLNAKHNLGEASLIERTNRYTLAFGLLDTDNDGLISLTELRDAEIKAGR